MDIVIIINTIGDIPWALQHLWLSRGGKFRTIAFTLQGTGGMPRLIVSLLACLLLLLPPPCTARRHHTFFWGDNEKAQIDATNDIHDDGKDCYTWCSVITQSATCSYLCDGTASAWAAGFPASPLSFLWSDGNTQQTRTGLCSGTYSVTVTDPRTSCTAVCMGTVEAPPPLALTVRAQNVLCKGESSGAINLTVTGGTPCYQYLWQSIPATSPPGFNANAEDIERITARHYTVIVTDSQGCHASVSQTVAEPASALTATTSVVPVKCYGGPTGAASVSPAGGVEPYVIQWSNGQDGLSITNVVAGTYNVLVRDAFGCSFRTCAIVTQPSRVEVSAVVTDSGCQQDDGSIHLSLVGGTPPYTFSWSSPNSTFTSTAQNIDNLAPGIYVVHVADLYGCSVRGRVLVTRDCVTTNPPTTTLAPGSAAPTAPSPPPSAAPTDDTCCTLTQRYWRNHHTGSKSPATPDLCWNRTGIWPVNGAPLPFYKCGHYNWYTILTTPPSKDEHFHSILVSAKQYIAAVLNLACGDHGGPCDNTGCVLRDALPTPAKGHHVAPPNFCNADCEGAPVLTQTVIGCLCELHAIYAGTCTVDAHLKQRVLNCAMILGAFNKGRYPDFAHCSGRSRM